MQTDQHQKSLLDRGKDIDNVECRGRIDNGQIESPEECRGTSWRCQGLWGAGMNANAAGCIDTDEAE